MPNATIQFAKLSGSGNDFICIDNSDGAYDAYIRDPLKVSHLARELCHRGTGVGADGVVFACRPEIAEVADMMACFYEPDGSEAELCGNGMGCFVRYVTDGWCACRRGTEIRILTGAGVVLGCQVEDGYVKVCIPLPEETASGIGITAGGCPWSLDYAVTGVPHAVAWVPDVNALDVDHVGKAIRRHERFAPRGVNANFVQVLAAGEIAVRTFEFGVEGETLACGTGSAAAAMLAVRRFGWPEDYRAGRKPILVHARSGDVLRIWVTWDGDHVTDLCLETVVRYICTGQVHEDFAARVLNPPAADAIGAGA